jgi:uncharacterized protein
MNKNAQSYIIQLNLQPHPEGGYFREVYHSNEIIKKKSLPTRYDGNRNFSTSIYFLLEGEQKSKFHRLKSDEQWHFYDGCPVKIYILNENGELSVTTLGDNILNGEVFQTVIKRNNWFAAELIDKNSFCLVGCVVSPGFNFNDFELANRDELITTYPQHKGLVIRLTS